MDARKFFYVSLGVLALAVAYHLGAVRSEAQGGGTFVGVGVEPGRETAFALTSSGDVYWFRTRVSDGFSAAYYGNVLGGPVNRTGFSGDLVT